MVSLPFGLAGVVEQRRQVEEFRLREQGHRLAQGRLGRRHRPPQPLQPFHHPQGMFANGMLMRLIEGQ